MSSRSRGGNADPDASSSSSSSSSSKGKGKEKESSSSGASAGGSSLTGFVAGTASGLTKCYVGHPLDTLKVRLQCSPPGTYQGLRDVFMQLLRKEGLMAVYKGVSLPAIAWAATDSILLGSLHNYRLFWSRVTRTGGQTGRPLSTLFHGLSGAMAGWTNSFFTTPVEHVKAQLQLQFQRVGAPRAGEQAVKALYAGPRDVIRHSVSLHGVKGLYKALPATLLFRTSFGPMFASYDTIHRQLARLRGTRFELSPSASTFLAGGLASELFWLIALPADVVKNRLMADSLTKPRYDGIRSAARSVWDEPGKDARTLVRIRGFYKGLLPCLLRAFPTNASAILAFESVMHFMGAEKTIKH